MRKAFYRVIAVLLLLGLLLSMVSAVETESSLSAEEWEVLLRTNRERLAQGQQPLTATSWLQAACDIRAEEIHTKFDHSRLDNTTCFTVLQEVDTPSGLTTSGENIIAGYSSPKTAVEGWMESEGHRENILTAEYTHMGAGYARFSDGDRHYWVQFFAGSGRCSYSELRLLAQPAANYPEGTTIDAMKLTAVLTCANCGASYLPVMAELCSGYDPAVKGTQTVTLECFGLKTTFQVVIGTDTQTPTTSDDGGTSQTPTTPDDGGTSQTPTTPDDGGTSQTPTTPDDGGTSQTPTTPDDGGTSQTPTTPDDSGTSQTPTTPDDTVLKRFTDLPPKSDWSYNGIRFAVERGLISGMSNTTFGPKVTMTRAMLVTILWRHAGEKKQGGTSAFKDVPENIWYTDAVTWAANNGIVFGINKTEFDPTGEITREDLVTILYRYCVWKECDTKNSTDLSHFPDEKSVSIYAREAMQWAVAEGLLHGIRSNGADYLVPQGSALREQVATILMNMLQNVIEK